jgi:hypothetical protein
MLPLLTIVEFPVTKIESVLPLTVRLTPALIVSVPDPSEMAVVELALRTPPAAACPVAMMLREEMRNVMEERILSFMEVL